MTQTKESTVQIPVLSSDEMKIALSAVIRADKNLRSVVFILGVLLAISMGLIWHLASREIQAEAFGLTKDGRVYPLSRIEGDIFKTSTVIAWAKERAEKMYSFNFRTVEGEWPNSLDAFLLESAKKDWLKSLRSQGYIDDVMAKSAVMYANVDGEVLYRGKTRNEDLKIDVSVVEVPLKVTLDARNSTADRNREFRVVMQLKIGHVGFKNPKYEGLAIGSFKLAARK